MSNVIQWFEIPVTDLARAKNFYENILAVELKEMKTPNGLEMAVFPSKNEEVGGALTYQPDFYKAGQQGALIYLNANPDLQDVLDRLEDQHHGEIVVPKTQITEEHGYMAVFLDSEGNRIALISQE
jgi:hypothetical protein